MLNALCSVRAKGAATFVGSIQFEFIQLPIQFDSIHSPELRWTTRGKCIDERHIRVADESREDGEGHVPNFLHILDEFLQNTRTRVARALRIRSVASVRCRLMDGVLHTYEHGAQCQCQMPVPVPVPASAPAPVSWFWS